MNNDSNRLTNKGSRKGSVILLAMVATIVLAIAMASLFSLFRFTKQSTERRNLSLAARLLAEEAIEDTFWNIRESKLGDTNVWTNGGTNGNATTFTRVTTGLMKNGRSSSVSQEVIQTALNINGDTSYIYDIEVSAIVDGPYDTRARDGFELTIENLATLPELAAMRVMDNERSNWRFDQIGSYDSSVDQITGEELYSYDWNLPMDSGVTYQGKALWDDTGMNLLHSYQPLEIFIGSWGHSVEGSNIPYVSYYSRDLEASQGQSEPLNIYYARRSDVEKNSNTTLSAGDGKDFFDFVTGANEAQSEEALQTVTGSTNFNVLQNNENNLINFLNELTTNSDYNPDENQYNFIETAGLSSSKNNFDGTYEGSPYFGGNIKLNSRQIDSSSADETPQGATASNVTQGDSSQYVVISGGDVANNKPVIYNVTDNPNGKRIIVDNDSNVILYVNDINNGGNNDDFKSTVIHVRDGGKLTVHLGPDLDSFNANSAAVAQSGNPQDLVILDEAKKTEITDANGNGTGAYEYVGTNIALGDPYRQYQPYKALNLDNANHPTVALVYAPHATVYTDHIAGVVVSDHFQSHGVIMLDRHSLTNNFYLSNLITNQSKRFAVIDLERSKGRSKI